MKKLHKNVKKKMKKKLAIIQILVYNLRGDRKERNNEKAICIVLACSVDGGDVRLRRAVLWG